MNDLKREVEEVWLEVNQELGMPERILPEPDLVDAHLFRRERKLFLNDSVELCAPAIYGSLLLYNSADRGIPTEQRQPIVIYVMSEGGELDDMWLLIDLVQLSATPVWTVNLGLAASAAALVYLAGSRRLMMPNAKVLLHEGSARMSGDANKLLDAAADYDRDIQKMREFIMARTTIPRNLLDRHKKDDWYLYADTCLRYGVCHQVVTSLEEIV